MSRRAAALDGDPPPGAVVQRARARLLGVLAAVLERLPRRVVDAGADAAGHLWYLVAPRRAAIGRGNLRHIATWLAAEGRGSARARAAATDDQALERLLRAAFRHAKRTYTEMLRGRATARDIHRDLILETPEAIGAAFAGGGPAIVVSMHYGSLSGVAAALFDRYPMRVTVPMETLPDPALQRLLQRLRSVSGPRIVPLENARAELRRALARGESVGLVADRDIGGGGIAVPLFGLPAPLPIGAAFLAVESGLPLQVAVLRRARDGFRCRLKTVPVPPAGPSRRERVTAVLADLAHAFEDLVAPAPEQWTAVFYPTWDEVWPLPRHRLPAARPAGEAESSS